MLMPLLPLSFPSFLETDKQDEKFLLGGETVLWCGLMSAIKLDMAL